MSDIESSILKLARRLGIISGKKALQKYVYFLQEAESVPLGLRYDMYQYGPYSQELEWTTREMEATRRINVRVVDETFQISTTYAGSDSEPDPVINRLVEKLGENRPRDLELLASLHYLASLRPYGATPPEKASLKEKLLLWKGTKFSAAQIESGIAKLESIGYLPTGT